MISVADQLRSRQRAESLKLGPAERVRQAFALGDEIVADHAARLGVDLDEARRRLRLQRQAGRRFSRCLQLLPT